MNVYNPFNNEIIGEINLLNEEEVLNIVEKAKASVHEMESLSGFERAEILKEIIRGINECFDDFVKTIIIESGKPYIYAKAELERAIQTFNFAVEEANRLPHEIFNLDSSPKGKGLKGELIMFPVGLIFGISPFNFPLNLAVHKIAPAIATGCPIILKPSSKTPLTMKLLKRIMDKTALPKDAFSVVNCSRETGNILIEHKDIKVLSFTGSPAVGWDMKAKAGKKKVILELGGNAAAIICEDADIENAVNELLVGGFAYSGQVCIHTQRIYVHQRLFATFLDLFKEKVDQLVVGDPLNEATGFSCMIDEENAKRVEKWVDEAVQNGARLVTGGKRKNNFYAPTILTNVPDTAKVRNEEVFGPVVIIEPIENLDQAIQQVNDSKWGLQASIFTDQITNRNKAFNQLQVGALIHNKSTTFRVDNMPYGGIKDSGFGREGVRYTMKDYLEPKLLVRE